MGIWLMPAPESLAIVEVKFRNESDLAIAVDTLRPLRVNGTINGLPNMRCALAWRRACHLARADRYDKPSPLPDSVLAEMMRKLNIGWWNMNIGLYGPGEVTAAQLKTVQAAFGAVPGAEVNAHTLDEADARLGRTVAAAARGPACPASKPSQLINWLTAARARTSNYSPVFPPRGRDAVKLYKLTAPPLWVVASISAAPSIISSSIAWR